MADEVALIVRLSAGTRPARAVIDFINDGTEEVTELSEKVRNSFAA